MERGQSFFAGFWVHATELIMRMKVVLAVFLISLLVLLFLPGNSDFFALTNDYKPLMSVFLTYIGNMFLPTGAQLFANSMSDPITLYVYAALIFAVGITLPVFAYEAYKFINPALYANERKALFPFVTIVSILFILGSIFGFYILAPSFIQGFIPFYTAVNVVPLYPVMDFYSTIFFTVIVSGVLFTIPAFFVLLVKFGILHTRSVTKQRKYIYLGLLVAAMLISPGATPLGDLYLFVALLLLVELSVFTGKYYERKLSKGKSQSNLTQWFAPNSVCKYCRTEIPKDATICPKCKIYLS